MPNLKLDLLIDGVGKVVLTDQHYIAQGGEAAVFKYDKLAVKIYHDVKKMVPIKKIQELQKIQPKNVIKPKHLVFSKAGKEVGYAMDFIDKSHPFCKLFTKAFKLQNNLTPQVVNDLVAEFQTTLAAIHQDKCLVVDLNENNLRSSLDFKTSFFIDVDSYQTPSYRASAIMENIRDRLVKNNNFTELSDWFSFAIIAFQLYINCHPYQGSHPKYKPKDWPQRMDDGVSCFDKGACLPPICNPFTVIPQRHLDWMKAVFVKNERSIPPSMSSTAPAAVPVQIVIVQGTAQFDVHQEFTCPEPILQIYSCFGSFFFVTKKNVYNQNGIRMMDGLDKYDKVLMCETDKLMPIVALLKDGKATFSKLNKEIVGTINTKDMLARNGCIYTTNGNKLIRNTFIEFDKIIHDTKYVENISDISIEFFSGVIIQDILGHKTLTIPYEKDKCKTVHIPELAKHRLLDAKAEGNVVVIIGEHKGKYDRFVIQFDFSQGSYKSWLDADISYDTINFTCLGNGLVILLTADDEVSIFRDFNQIKRVNNPPFDSSMFLFNSSSKVLFVDQTTVFSVKTK